MNASAGSPPVDWTLQTSGTTRILNAVTYGDGVFVAVGDSGTILTSPDGATWTVRNSGTSYQLLAVTYSASLDAFFAVGAAATILASNDQGASWTPIAPPAGFGTDLRGVTSASRAGGVQFVAVGSNRALTATNPWSTWTAQDLSSVTSDSLLAVASNGERIIYAPNPDPVFVAVGTKGTVLVSKDATQWTRLSCDFSGSITAITRYLDNGDNFTAVGYSSTAPIGQRFLFVSPSSCTSQFAPDTPAGFWPLDAIAYGSIVDGNDYTVAAGYSQIVISEQYDRRKWFFARTGLPQLNGLAYGARSFVAVGDRGAIYRSSAGTPHAVHLGCFADDANRAFPVLLYRSGATVESCTRAAAAKGYTYAGLQWYGACWAGYAPGYYLDEGKCDTPCTANPSQMCGGAWHNTVYWTGVKPPAPTTSLGCYVDDASRALDALLIPSGATVESCVAAAAARGFKYAGVQWYGQCFAGNSTGVRASDQSQCNTYCRASPDEKCGGSYRNSLYATGVTPPSLPATIAYMGCYSDDANHALPAELIRSGATVETCVAAAKATGYAYAGLQWYGVCLAGNSPAYTLHTEVPSPCKTPCTANPSQTCGGEWFSSIYLTPP